MTSLKGISSIGSEIFIYLYIAMLKWDAGPNIKYATVGFTQSKPFLEAGEPLIKHKKRKKKRK